MFFSPPFLSRPYAIAAAVGSLMMRATFKPAITPASLVACRCASLKYAGKGHRAPQERMNQCYCHL
jgi:hypothetical protein